MSAKHPEEWRAVVGYEGQYEVSDLGRVRSVDRVDPKGHSRHSQIMTQSLVKGIYPRVTLTKNGIEKSCRVHRIVLEAFRGPCPPGLEGCHNDGNPCNTRADNLRWDTKKANASDKRAHGTIPSGERHYAAKISEDDVRRIFQLRTEGLTLKQIGARIGLRSTGHVCAILRGEKWRHLREREREAA